MVYTVVKDVLENIIKKLGRVKKIKKHTLDEYKKRKVVPTRLTFEEKYPSSTEYKTPESIKFLKNFNFKKKKVKKDRKL